MPTSHYTYTPRELQQRFLAELIRLRRQAQRMKNDRVSKALSALIYRRTMPAKRGGNVAN